MTLDAASSIHQFTLSYQGSALVDHSMSVRELAPALAAIGDLFERSNDLLYLGSAEVDTKVTATAPASFDITLVVEMARKTISVLGSPLVTAAVNLFQLIVMTIKLLKHLRGESTALANSTDGQVAKELENFEIRTEDFELSAQASPETMQSVLPHALQLLRDYPYRKSLHELVDPLHRDGIDRLSIKDSTRELEVIEKDDLPFFDPSSDQTDSERVTTLQRMLTVIAPYLGEGTGQWRLRDEGTIHYYNVKDSQFIENVKRGSFSFTVGDRLDCQVQYTEITRDDGTDRIDRDIIRVFRHYPRDNEGVQLHIPNV